jgi:hypothetical protein
MKVKITKEVEVELGTLMVKAEPRYWEDSEINGVNDTKNGDNVPCKVNNLWCPIIDIESGTIINWEKGTIAKIHYKVADCCGYELLDKNGYVINSFEDGYVPRTLYPKENGYGDYIIMDIDENGKIQNFKFYPNDFEGVSIINKQ